MSVNRKPVNREIHSASLTSPSDVHFEGSFSCATVKRPRRHGKRYWSVYGMVHDLVSRCNTN